MYQDIAKILTDATVPLDPEFRIDYTLFTGSTWNRWEQELEEILPRFAWIDDEAHVVNALFAQRRLALTEAKRHTGPWPHHFLIHHYDECEGHEIYCQRCYLSDRYADIRSTPCVTQPIAPNIYDNEDGTEVPF